MNFANQITGGKQSKGASVQFTSQVSTRLSLQLWFDVTVMGPEAQEKPDVRVYTEKIANFLKPTEKSGKKGKIKVPPEVRFSWGTFRFDGFITSMDENLEFFSEDGYPLRASVSLSISSQDFQFEFNPLENNSETGDTVAVPGTEPLQQAKEGDTVQNIASKSGNKNDWKDIAKANGIENGRRMEEGTLINLSLIKNAGNYLDSL